MVELWNGHGDPSRGVVPAREGEGRGSGTTGRRWGLRNTRPGMRVSPPGGRAHETSPAPAPPPHEGLQIIPLPDLLLLTPEGGGGPAIGDQKAQTAYSPPHNRAVITSFGDSGGVPKNILRSGRSVPANSRPFNARDLLSLMNTHAGEALCVKWLNGSRPIFFLGRYCLSARGQLGARMGCGRRQ